MDMTPKPLKVGGCLTYAGLRAALEREEFAALLANRADTTPTDVAVETEVAAGATEGGSTGINGASNDVSMSSADIAASPLHQHAIDSDGNHSHTGNADGVGDHHGQSTLHGRELCDLRGCGLKQANISIGDRYERLVVVADAPRRKNDRYLVCLCDCGAHHEVRAFSLISGAIRSCGCLRRENASEQLSKWRRRRSAPLSTAQ